VTRQWVGLIDLKNWELTLLFLILNFIDSCCVWLSTTDQRHLTPRWPPPLLLGNVTFYKSISITYAYLVPSLSKLDHRRVVAASMLTNPSQHSKHQKERALCSWRPAPSSIFKDDLVGSFRCQTVWACCDVTERCRAWWAGAALSIIHTPDVAKERVSPPTYSFI